MKSPHLITSPPSPGSRLWFHFPSLPGTSTLMDSPSEGSLTVANYYARYYYYQHYWRKRKPFKMPPDDVLLEIFDFLLREDRKMGEWITLAHVCRRWRSVVFQSPLRLNLQLLCTPKTRMRDTLDIWPPLPLIIRDYGIFGDETGADNIIAALEHNDRVCKIIFNCFSRPELKYVTDSAAMQKPFSELTHLRLVIHDDDEWPPILPDSFLGGTAPRLRSLDLLNVPFLGLPKLLLSATHLVHLYLCDIPRSGYIPPEAIATSLSALTSLEDLHLYFRFPRPRPALTIRRPPPLTCSILPSLTKFEFKGTSEYLEEIFTRIDAPRLDGLQIVFFNQIIFDTPRLFQFISRRPTLRAPKKAHIAFNSEAVFVRFSSQTSDYGVLSVQIPCTASEWQLSSLEQLCASSLPPVFTLEDLYMVEERYPSRPPRWHDDVENTLWLDLLRSFVAVKNLYLSDEFVPRIAPALQELVGGRTTEFLPTLENIFSGAFQPSGPIHEGIEKFVASRRLTSHPVAVSRCDESKIYDW